MDLSSRLDGQFDGKLTDEQLERAKSLKTPEELLALAKEVGVELSDEQLDAVSGGGWAPCMKEYI